jgi:hypothetical protein
LQARVHQFRRLRPRHRDVRHGLLPHGRYLANGGDQRFLGYRGKCHADTFNNVQLFIINRDDSLGQSHTVTVYFRKSSEDDTTGQSTWEWIAEVDAADSVSGTNTIAGWGTLIFNSKGVLVSGGEAQTVSFNFSNGAEQNQSIDLVFGSGTDGGTTTQYTIASTTNYQTQDGYPPGTLESVAVSSDGIISGTYSNGQTIQLYQVTLASFNNPNGLEKEGATSIPPPSSRASPTPPHRQRRPRDHKLQLPGRIECGPRNGIRQAHRGTEGIPGKFQGHHHHG